MTILLTSTALFISTVRPVTIMARSMTRKLLIITALLAGAAALPGCGIKGDLDRPAPLWGEASPNAPKPPKTVSNDPLVEPDLDDEPGYGVDVAD